jgi:hypothetical protein
VPPLIALTISITVLACLDTYLTATILPIPVWVTFIAWASFFACGGGGAGFMKSVLSNWIGVIIATMSLLAISMLPPSPVFAAISVGVGSGLMILVSAVPSLGFPPAIVFGFASLVGTVAATGHPVTEAGATHPTLIAALSMLVGALFGFASEAFTNILVVRVRAKAEAQ